MDKDSGRTVSQREQHKIDAFERLAPTRVDKALKAINVLGNLANRNNYSYDEVQAQAIIDALTSEVRALQSSFKQELNKNRRKFELPSRKN
jgi:hypothetical protein